MKFRNKYIFLFISSTFLLLIMLFAISFALFENSINIKADNIILMQNKKEDTKKQRKEFKEYIDRIEKESKGLFLIKKNNSGHYQVLSSKKAKPWKIFSIVLLITLYILSGVFDSKIDKYYYIPKKVTKKELCLGVPIFIIYILSLKTLFILKNVHLPLEPILVILFILNTIMVCVPIYWVYVYFYNQKLIKE